jgi:hypothetical protein
MSKAAQYGFCDACQRRYQGEICPFCRVSAQVERKAVVASTAPPMAKSVESMAKSMAKPDLPMAKRVAKPDGDMAKAPSAKPSYKYRDPDKRREYQRDLMRRRAAEKKAVSLAQE